MKYIRYLFSGLLIAAALCIGCDIFQIFLYAFDDFWQTSFYVKEEISTEQMKEQIFESAEEYGIEVIYIDKHISGDYFTQVDIYCSNAAEEMFAREYQLKEGHYGSLLSGWSDIYFHPTEELERELMERDPEGYFILGQTENAMEYKAALVDTYGGSLPRPKERDSVREALVQLVWIWFAVGILIWLLTYYKTVRIRKEIVIRLSLGESIGRIVLCHSILDALWYCGCFCATLLIIYRAYHCLFLINYAATALAVIILGVFLIYASLLRCDLKLGFSGIQMSRKLLDVSYVLKTVLTFVLAVSAASTIALWVRYSEMEKQREFYEARKEYFYLHIPDYSGVNGKWLYRYYFSEFDMQFTYGNIAYDIENQDKLAICTNANLKDYLCENLPSVADEISKSTACVLIPENETLSDYSLEILIHFSASFANLQDEDVQIISYSDRAYIINYDVYKGYVRSYCPAIIYNNCIEDAIPIEEERYLSELSFDKVMMKPDIAVIEEFCTEHGYRYTLENVWLTFEHELSNLKRVAVMNMFLLLFQCAVELFLSLAIIRLEFEANRLEIMVKKILGYSVLERIRKQLILTLVSGLSGIFATVVFYTVFDLTHIGTVCIIILILMSVESAVIIGKFLQMEQESIQKTLKGGFL
ncbi:MAG: hypothetical protein K2K21_11005 [Lachnospiraceae bacterium]|nr:hypothetical protein [Lachnospiraceae bacterium]